MASLFRFGRAFWHFVTVAARKVLGTMPYRRRIVGACPALKIQRQLAGLRQSVPCLQKPCRMRLPYFSQSFSAHSMRVQASLEMQRWIRIDWGASIRWASGADTSKLHCKSRARTRRLSKDGSLISAKRVCDTDIGVSTSCCDGRDGR